MVTGCVEPHFTKKLLGLKRLIVFLFQVDIVRPHLIKAVELHFRHTCCHDRNKFIELRIGNVDANENSKGNAVAKSIAKEVEKKLLHKVLEKYHTNGWT